MNRKHLILAAVAVVAVAVSSAVTIGHANAADNGGVVIFSPPGSTADLWDGYNECVPVANPVPQSLGDGTITAWFQIDCEWSVPAMRVYLQLIDFSNGNGSNVDDQVTYNFFRGTAQTSLPCASGTYGGYALVQVDEGNGVLSEGWYTGEVTIDCSAGFPGWV